MAENKKSIVVYADWIKKFEALTDDEAGKLIKHFFRYVNDQNPIAPDRITELSFIDIEQSLKRDLIKWEKRAERSRENGKKGGRPEVKENPEKPKETQQVILEPKKPDSVSVNDNVNVNDILLKKETKINNTPTAKFSFFNSLINLGVDKQLANDWLAVRKKKNLSNTETAFKNLKIEFEKCGKPIPVIIEKCATESWGGFKASWDWKDGQTKNSETIVAGRQTMETIKKNLDGSNLYVPGI